MEVEQGGEEQLAEPGADKQGLALASRVFCLDTLHGVLDDIESANDGLYGKVLSNDEPVQVGAGHDV